MMPSLNMSFQVNMEEFERRIEALSKAIHESLGRRCCSECGRPFEKTSVGQELTGRAIDLHRRFIK